MARIDDLKAEKQRMLDWKAEQTKICQDRIVQIAKHADGHCAQLDQDIADEQARLDKAAAAAPAKKAGK